MNYSRREGYEDFKLYFQIAERYEFAVIKEHLTRYRLTPGSMSSNILQMLRSEELVTSASRKAYPQYASEFDEGRNNTLISLTRRALSAGDLPLAAALAAKLFQNDRRIALKLLARLPLLSLLKRGVR